MTTDVMKLARECGFKISSGSYRNNISGTDANLKAFASALLADAQSKAVPIKPAIVECVTDETGPEWHVSFIVGKTKFRSLVTNSESKAKQTADDLNRALMLPCVDIDFLGLALDLEAAAAKSESQTSERAMLAAAQALHRLAAAPKMEGEKAT